jgi:hypothetical protein
VVIDADGGSKRYEVVEHSILTPSIQRITHALLFSVIRKPDAVSTNQHSDRIRWRKLSDSRFRREMGRNCTFGVDSRQGNSSFLDETEPEYPY